MGKTISETRRKQNRVMGWRENWMGQGLLPEDKEEPALQVTGTRSSRPVPGCRGGHELGRLRELPSEPCAESRNRRGERSLQDQVP